MAENNLYQTGELADTCETTVRTVQYYDNKGLLAPSGYSEGGRRLYTETDAEQLRFILLLKTLGLSLNQIKGVLESPNRNTVLKLLLDERAEEISRELDEQTHALGILNTARADLERFGKLIATNKPAMVTRMIDDRARRTMWIKMIALGIVMDTAWISTLILGIMTGTWWPFPLALIFVFGVGMWLVLKYSAHSTYLCPVCGAEFRPKIRAFLLSGHTPYTRRLVCPCCHEKDWCVERYHALPLKITPGECVPGTCHHACEVKAGDTHANA